MAENHVKIKWFCATLPTGFRLKNPAAILNKKTLLRNKVFVTIN
tara:strand:- start:155 stop:286 length:132 start_codon:yes stop_codon:yes gene_type:complete